MKLSNIEQGTRVVFLFPGQGSQYYQMAKQLFETQPFFAHEMQLLDKYYHETYNCSLLSELYGPRSISSPLEDIEYSHPLIVMVEYSLARLIEHSGVKPDLLVGSSLGEFVAHAFAGKVSIYRVLDMIRSQSLLAKKSLADGFLLVVFSTRTLFLNSYVLSSCSHLAGVGFEGSFILAGDRKFLTDIKNELTKLDVVFQVLPVRVPFHSPLVDPIKEQWMESFDREVASTSRVDVLPQLGETDLSYSATLWRNVRQTINFPEQMEQLPSDKPYLFIDVGPGGTLANWNKQSGRGGSRWKNLSVLSPMGGDPFRFEQLLEISKNLGTG